MIPRSDAVQARQKLAETTSTVGAGILGGGVALLIAELLRPYAVALLLLGLAMHAWGMYDKHRLESGIGTTRVWWAEVLYWGCLAALIALAVFIAKTGL